MERLLYKEAFASNVSEFRLIEEIKQKTARMNTDNISRTKAYQNYHFRNKEFFWPFLASMVSRNAGWNMGDLQLTEFRMLMPCKGRRWIFYTYERANWLIFADAYPQLLLYEESKQLGLPLFHLLKEFGVSSFMVEEWKRFWQDRDRKRLDTALIINEQHVIQNPVLDKEEYKRKVFSTFPYWLQDHLHFSTVLFPTLEGDLFGISVHGFRKVSNRIRLGKGLLGIVSKPGLYDRFVRFARMTEPTGSRADFERYLFQQTRKGHHLPLRMLYPIINHERKEYKDWSTYTRNVEKHFKHVKLPGQVKLNDWYEHKRLEIHVLAKWKAFFRIKENK
ncbi:DUF2515 family protein [Alkalihalobacillus sp. TS-13]|uniref:DUF2515 family protein n=1 Tax=Alkalihalobacillus sp. TS-13 TaxID=2842455 RepID=UPI001C8886A1|nr:DUF2515 family protein [Alkalihalobacillus sp. TS-13]